MPLRAVGIMPKYDPEKYSWRGCKVSDMSGDDARQAVCQLLHPIQDAATMKENIMKNKLLLDKLRALNATPQ
jgi:hypothetical protein